MQVRVRGLASHARRATPPRRKGGPAEMAMARWPMATLLSSVAPIGCHPSDVRGMLPAWSRPAAAELAGEMGMFCFFLDFRG